MYTVTLANEHLRGAVWVLGEDRINDGSFVVVDYETPYLLGL